MIAELGMTSGFPDIHFQAEMPNEASKPRTNFVLRPHPAFSVGAFHAKQESDSVRTHRTILVFLRQCISKEVNGLFFLPADLGTFDLHGRDEKFCAECAG